MSKVWKVLTLTCEEAAHLLSDDQDRELTRLERIALRAHLVSCRKCKQFKRQLALIKRATTFIEPLSEQAKERIRAGLSKHKD